MFNPKKPAYQLIAVVAAFIIQFVFTTAQATTEVPDAWLSEATATIKLQEQQLNTVTTGKTDVASLTEPLKNISQIKSQAQNCITDTESQLQKATLDLAILGEISSKENPEVSKKRKSLTQQHKELDKQLATCKLLLLQSQDLIKTINDLQQNILAQQLSARTPNIIDVLEENIRQPAAGLQDTFNFLSTQYQSTAIEQTATGSADIYIYRGSGAGHTIQTHASTDNFNICSLRRQRCRTKSGCTDQHIQRPACVITGTVYSTVFFYRTAFKPLALYNQSQLCICYLPGNST